VLPLFLAVSAATAQEPLSASEAKVVNYAFATQLGSGVYSVAGRLIQVYRIPFSYKVREEKEGDWGLRVTFPVTVGLYDFKAVDVLETGVPEHMDAASLVPGLEFRVPVLKDWLLKPYMEAGVGKEHSGGADFRIASGGVRSLADFRPGNFTLARGNTLGYAGVEPTGDRPADDLVMFETGLEARHSLGAIRGNPMASASTASWTSRTTTRASPWPAAPPLATTTSTRSASPTGPAKAPGSGRSRFPASDSAGGSARTFPPSAWSSGSRASRSRGEGSGRAVIASVRSRVRHREDPAGTALPGPAGER